MSQKIPTIENLQKEAWQTAEDKGFHKGIDPTSRDGLLVRLALVHTEVSEAAQVVKRHWKGDDTDPDALDDFALELSDVLIRILDIAGSLDMDLESYVLVTMDANKKRPYRYGTPDEGQGV